MLVCIIITGYVAVTIEMSTYISSTQLAEALRSRTIEISLPRPPYDISLDRGKLVAYYSRDTKRSFRLTPFTDFYKRSAFYACSSMLLQVLRQSMGDLSDPRRLSRELVH
jgi:hypothetical protein